MAVVCEVLGKVSVKKKTSQKSEELAVDFFVASKKVVVATCFKNKADDAKGRSLSALQGRRGVRRGKDTF